MKQEKMAQAVQQQVEATAAHARSLSFLDVAKKAGDKNLIAQMETVVRQDQHRLTEAMAEVQFQAVATFVEGRIDDRLNDMRGAVDKAVKGQLHSVKEYVARRLDIAELGTEARMPKHEWRGTEIRFEIEPGVWGQWVDLEGPRGYNGMSVGAGALSTKRLELDGGGAFDSDTPLDGGFAGTDFTGIPGVGGGGPATVYSPTAFDGGRA